VSELFFIERLCGLGMCDSKHMPNTPLATHKAVVIDIPPLVLTGAWIVDLSEALGGNEGLVLRQNNANRK
jgi:hypothetical protein